MVLKDGGGEISRGDEHAQIKNLVVAERLITGVIKLNFMDSRKLRIDRQTGDMQIAALFSGTCEKGPDENAPNKF